MPAPDLWQSQDVMDLPVVGKLAFIALISHADDAGRLKTTAGHLARIAHLEDVRVEEIQEAMDLMEARTMIQQSNVDGARFVQITNWMRHQKIDHPKPSAYPPAK